MRMPTICRIAWSLWWGGLAFYAGAVTPIGSHILGADVQGLVTQQVTHALNALGALALLLIAPATFFRRPRSRRMVWLWLALAAVLVVQLAIHVRLDVLLENGDTGPVFYQWHRVYLWGVAVQVLAGWYPLAILGQDDAGALAASESLRRR